MAAMIIDELSPAACMEVVASNRVARLAVASGVQPYVVPIYYALDGGYLHSFTLPGKKLEWMRANPRVCVQVDEQSPDGWRSVVIDGTFEELPDRLGHKHARERAWQLLSRHAEWWEPGAIKPGPPSHVQRTDRLFYRISIDQVSGREARSEPSG